MVHFKYLAKRFLFSNDRSFRVYFRVAKTKYTLISVCWQGIMRSNFSNLITTRLLQVNAIAMFNINKRNKTTYTAENLAVSKLGLLSLIIFKSFNYYIVAPHSGVKGNVYRKRLWFNCFKFLYLSKGFFFCICVDFGSIIFVNHKYHKLAFEHGSGEDQKLTSNLPLFKS